MRLPYQRTKFATDYTAADLVLLVYVDKAEGSLSGPGTCRILQREHTEYGQVGHPYGCTSAVRPQSLGTRPSLAD
jgi:hypothetical protein